MKKTGRVLMTAELGEEYGFVDINGEEKMVFYFYVFCKGVFAITKSPQLLMQQCDCFAVQVFASNWPGFM